MYYLIGSIIGWYLSPLIIKLMNKGVWIAGIICLLIALLAVALPYLIMN